MPLLDLVQSPTAKKTLAVALVVVVLLTGLPVAVGMVGMDCAECEAAVALCPVACAAVPLAATALLVLAAWILWAAAPRRHRLQFAWALDPPPRLA